MKTLFFIFLFAASFFTHAENCIWQGKEIKIEDSVWIFDPYLVKKLTDKLDNQGLSEEQIQHRINTSDWVGYRVVCRASVVLNPNPTSEADILHYGKPVMVMNSYARDLHQFLLEEASDTAQN